MKDRTYKRIEAVRKAGEILRYLGTQKQPIDANEIAKAAGLAIGTVMCHLATLEDLGFVQNVGDHWKIGTGLALLWARVKSNLEGEKMLIEQTLKELEGTDGSTVDPRDGGSSDVDRTE